MKSGRVLEQMQSLAGELSFLVQNLHKVNREVGETKVLLNNHLRHHDIYLKCVMLPVLAGVVILIAEKIYTYMGG